MSGTTSLPARPGDNLKLAIGFMLANLSAMAFVSLLVKWVTTDQTQIPLVEVLFFRFAGTLPVFFWIMMRNGGWRSLKTDHPVAHLLRGAFGITSLALFFYSLASIPLADAMALSYAAPIFITIFAIPILGERVGLRRWSAIAFGFLGVLLIARPDAGNFGLGALAGIGSAFFGALVSIWLRRLGKTEPAFRIVIYYNAAGALIFGTWTFATGWVLPVGWTLLALIALGLLAAAQQLSFALAYRNAEASLLAPFEYLLLPFAALLGFFLWQEVPAAATWAGGAIIIASGLFMLYREVKAHSRRPLTGNRG